MAQKCIIYYSFNEFYGDNQEWEKKRAHQRAVSRTIAAAEKEAENRTPPTAKGDQRGGWSSAYPGEWYNQQIQWMQRSKLKRELELVRHEESLMQTRTPKHAVLGNLLETPKTKPYSDFKCATTSHIKPVKPMTPIRKGTPSKKAIRNVDNFTLTMETTKALSLFEDLQTILTRKDRRRVHLHYILSSCT